MKKLLAAAVIAAVLAGLPALALAADEKTVEGTIQSVDPAGQTLTLLDGMTFTLPSNVSTESLQAGEDVTITYQDDGKGDPVATAIWIDSGPDEGGN